MPLNETSIAGYVALTGEPVNVADAYNLPPGSPFSISRSFDETSGYRTKSMLVVPMRDHDDQVIGVLQLINKKRDAKAVLRPVSLVEEMVIPFTSVDEELARLAGQPGRGRLREHHAHPEDPAPLRLLRPRRGDRDRVARPHDLRPFGARGRPHRRPRRDAGRARRRPLRGVSASPATRSRRSATPALLHDFGKVGCARRCLIKGKKLYAGEMLADPPALRLHPKVASRPTTCGPSSRRSSPGAPRGAPRGDGRGLRAPEGRGGARPAAGDERNEPTILEEESFRTLMDLTTRSFPDLARESR